MSGFFAIMEVCGQWAIPFVILTILMWGWYKKVPMYESFVTGAKEGFGIAVMIIPYLVAILFIIKVFTVSGAFDDIKVAGMWCLNQMGLGEYGESLELIPLALIRPLSGSGARGVLLEIYDVHGTDTFIGNVATLLMGSSETTFYVLTVYYGAIQVKKVRHTLPACLIADAVGIVIALLMGYLLYNTAS
ncbi:MAG: spore maturation protein [Bythopirellula sp.]|nr:spore maturation protein [Bythopirellula sp.]